MEKAHTLLKVKNAAWWVWFVGISLLFVFHFMITFFYNAPENPITTYFQNSINSYMNPVFQQNWSLFAPSPISENQEVWVSGEYTEGGQKHETGWINLTQPLIDDVRRNRFTPLQLVTGIVSGSTVNTINTFDADQNAYKKEFDAHKYTTELTLLQHVGSDALKQQYPDKQFQNISLQFIVSDFPDFNHYDEPDSKSQDSKFELPSMPFSPTVTMQ